MVAWAAQRLRAHRRLRHYLLTRASGKKAGTLER